MAYQTFQQWLANSSNTGWYSGTLKIATRPDDWSQTVGYGVPYLNMNIAHYKTLTNYINIRDYEETDSSSWWAMNTYIGYRNLCNIGTLENPNWTECLFSGSQNKYTGRWAWCKAYRHPGPDPVKVASASFRTVLASSRNNGSPVYFKTSDGGYVRAYGQGLRYEGCVLKIEGDPNERSMSEAVMSDAFLVTEPSLASHPYGNGSDDQGNPYYYAGATPSQELSPRFGLVGCSDNGTTRIDAGKIDRREFEVVNSPILETGDIAVFLIYRLWLPGPYASNNFTESVEGISFFGAGSDFEPEVEPGGDTDKWFWRMKNGSWNAESTFFVMKNGQWTAMEDL